MTYYSDDIYHQDAAVLHVSLPQVASKIELGSGSSPRGRGTGKGNFAAHIDDRFIPAGAGNGVWAGARPAMAAVHPRVGGERDAETDAQLQVRGSSPRGRGTALLHRAT